MDIPFHFGQGFTIFTHRIPTRNTQGRPAAAGWRAACSPRRFYPVIAVLLPWLAWGAIAASGLGFYLGIVSSPFPARHGELFPIAFIHVPAAWMAACLYLLMGFCAVAGVLFRLRLLSMMAEALAPTGAMFALVALWTGSLWGKPTWGTWWDARLAMELVLLLLFMAIVAFRTAIADAGQANRIVAVVALLGLAAVPAALSSAASWRAFHLTLPAHGGAESAANIFWGLLALFAGCWMYATAAALKRLRCVILENHRQSEWVTRSSGGLG